MNTRIYNLPFYDAFISYSHHNLEWAEQLAQKLSDNGFDIFFDKWSIPIGKDIPLSIERALNRSNKIIAVISASSLESEWAFFERTYKWEEIYLKNKNRMIPVIIEDCSLPDNIKRLKYIDFTKKTFTKNLKTLEKSIKDVSSLSIGPFEITQEMESDIYYLNYIIKKIEQYFRGHRLEAIKVVYAELTKNAFEHVKNPRVFVKFSVNEHFVELDIKDNGEGFDLLETFLKNKVELEENPLLQKKRGLLLLFNNCDYLDNEYIQSSHNVNAIIRKVKCLKKVHKYEELLNSNDFIVNYLSESKKTIYIKINNDISRALSQYVNFSYYQILNPKINKYILDITKVGFLDSGGIGTLLAMFIKLNNQFQGKLKFGVVASPKISVIFKVTLLNKVINVFNSLDEAESYVCY